MTMRRVWIGLVAVAFVAYLAASVDAQARVDVPHYIEGPVPLLGRAPVRAWGDADERARIAGALAARHYHPPAQGLTPPGYDEPWPADRPLDTPALLALVDERVREYHDNPYADDREAYLLFPLRDPAPLESLAAQGYRFRDPVWPPAVAGHAPGERGPPLFRGGEPVDKAALDVLLAHGVRRVGIQGAGDPIAAQAGTLVAVMLIFTALVVALEPVLFRPVRALLVERGRRLDAGVEQRRRNRQEEKRQADERVAGLVAAGRERQQRFDALRQRALAENDRILRQARAEETDAMRRAERELHHAVAAARAELQKEIEPLARATVAMILERSLPDPPPPPSAPPEAL